MSSSALPSPSGALSSPLRRESVVPGAGQRPELSPTERRALVAGVVVLHLVLLWALLQLGVVRQAMHRLAPLMVDFISAEAPPRPAPPPPRARRAPPMQPTPTPMVVAATTPQAPPAPAAFVVPEPVQAAAAPAATPAAPVSAPATVMLPPTPKPVAASALRYAVLPPVEMPLASRRLGESGTVLLRVVFDIRGHVRLASVHRSSGFARLDEQAMAAMRQARITPYLEHGQPIEVSAIAPLAYELE